jgi:hypothetical protein
MNNDYFKLMRRCAIKVVKDNVTHNQIFTYIREGPGYSQPTDLFDWLDNIPKKYEKYFEGGGYNIESISDEEAYNKAEEAYLDAKEKDLSIECLYCKEGAIALMDAAIGYKSKVYK